ncbi:uncharacterized protein F4807DRAFT_302277 [Annulohypoxylon truncatum]|uniref:uncharacterized protein n=1 Tax=Annulohypoxylon truncatum TaxID=327061 RepID=UPI002007AEB1|nr:uncharacterized protein F4807DRAFT_302277 [Annulohypoxylon truncatum]KAI1212861.1 hypothetical protein F4807DRAFT_302277 [Annulohypoxylon truncatum]
MSSDTFTHQVPINGTIQTEVLPGNKTNLYYILVSNLPWQTSWQQLKDHVRTVCAVDRVEVFNESTSGWVSVRGRENYDAALQLLDGGIFNGRPLFANGKNVSESIMIREPVGASKTAPKTASKTASKPTSKPTSKASSKASGSTSKTSHTPRFKTPPSTQYAASTPPLMSPLAAGYGEWTSPATSSPYTATSSMECAPYTVSNAVPYDYNETPGCYPYDTSSSSYLDQSAMGSSPTMVQYPYETNFSQQYQMSEYQNNDYAMYSSMPTPESAPSRPNNPSNGMIPTKQRKIIVKQLQPWININQVQDLIRKKAGSDADKIQHIDLPLTEGQESNRGYALITFQSEEVANKLIRRLDGYKYDGRELRVNYTKEGVSENENVRPRASGHKERRDDREKKEKKESTRGSSSHEKKNKSHKSGVVIAHGSSSSSSPSKKSDPKEKSSKRH